MPFNPMIADSLAESYRKALTSGEISKQRTMDNIDKAGGAVVDFVDEVYKGKNKRAADKIASESATAKSQLDFDRKKELVGMQLGAGAAGSKDKLVQEYYRARGVLGPLADKQKIPAQAPEDTNALSAYIGQMHSIAARSGKQFEEGMRNSSAAGAAYGEYEGTRNSQELNNLDWTD